MRGVARRHRTEDRLTRLYFGVSSVDETSLRHVLHSGAAMLLSFGIDYDSPEVWGYPKRGPVMLDSGAYTAHNTGKAIDREALLREALSGRYAESVALDAIGDPAESRANWLWSKEQGGDCWPTFHMDEPWELLKEYCAGSWKVALGGMAATDRRSGRTRWINECFRRSWPHRFHAFGTFSIAILERFPFHSADSAIWNLIVQRYGVCALPGVGGRQYKAAGRKNSMDQDLRRASTRFRVERLLRLEARLRSRWRLALAEADRKAPPRPTVTYKTYV